MDEPDDEVALDGGRITAGVVRVGATVRRPAAHSSAFTARLLLHLEAEGFDGAPRYLGRDRQGRDVLQYLPGTVPARFQRWSDHQVGAAGALLRRFHDATRGSTLAQGHEVVVHGDPGPNNAVMSADGTPTALIDFDGAAPGPAHRDLAYMLWTWVLSSRPDSWPVQAQAAQMKVMADAYGAGHSDRALLVEAMLQRQQDNARWWREQAAAGPGPRGATVEEMADRAAWSDRERAFTQANRQAWETALFV
ncbi:phosphotransferase family protein [Streptacidiphilus carbonis]|uniref:phosphotransferase family protein n=1 Tax=Streptacidiphilus carbonis TaxID=105422 RepID=UPI0005A94DC9|nr:aminoglycoside phosphotransferase family protein [Streptacidiphilus carbonis]